MPSSNTRKKARRQQLVSQNTKLAISLWRNDLSSVSRLELKSLSSDPGLSIGSGELRLIDGRWYVTHAGLLRLAQRRRCFGIQVQQVHRFCDPATDRWIFKATVYKSPRSKGFVGYGDADPSNISSLVRGAEMRVAETRAVNRALRKAYGIGLCSVEELGWTPKRPDPNIPTPNGSSPSSNGHGNGRPRLRDRLCLLIRQHGLDAGLVKAYAADYCGTPSLREATRASVEAFINELAKRATEDRAGLLCQLNSYAKTPEVGQ